jgi:Molybdopterin biosynthesis enzyme
MKEIKTRDAVGHVLCHDITQIIKDKVKDAIFRKGHVVCEEDIPVLLSLGKENLYIWEKKEGFLHENEGAEILRQICQGQYIRPSEVKEGKIDLFAECDGILKINTEKLEEINTLGEMMIATRHGNTQVKAGEKLAGTRVIPLLIETEKMEKARAVAGLMPLLNIKKFLPKKIGIVTTGNEILKGLIQDTFTSVIVEKIEAFGAKVIGRRISGDDTATITKDIEELIAEGADFIICTGGMSVDPDDKTPLAIKNTGANIISYGAPVLPGAMFLLSYYKENIPVVGLPGCVMYAKQTIFDLVLPRLMAGEILTAADLQVLGEGGLCLDCPTCTFPNCGFGK